MAERSNAIGQLKKFLNRHHWRYLTEEGQILRGLVNGDNAQWNWIAKFTPDERFVLFCACFPVKVSLRKRAAVAEYLTRANWCLQFGNFEMDWSDGQAIFRTCLPASAGSFNVQAIEHLVFGNCAMMDRYLPGLLAVALGNVKPEQAIDEAERGPQAAAASGSSDAATSDHTPTAPVSIEATVQETPKRLDQFSLGNN